MTLIDTPVAFDMVRKLFHPLGLLSVLDIGSSCRPQQLIDTNRHVCADPCAEALAKLDGKETWNLDAKAALERARTWEFDVIVMLDVIEHLEKDDGREVVRMALEKQPQVLILFTPWGFVPQEPCEPGGEWQRHRSGWLPDDFVGRWLFIPCCHQQGLDPLNGRNEPVQAFFAIWLRP